MFNHGSLGITRIGFPTAIWAPIGSIRVSTYYIYPRLSAFISASMGVYWRLLASIGASIGVYQRLSAPVRAYLRLFVRIHIYPRLSASISVYQHLLASISVYIYIYIYIISARLTASIGAHRRLLSVFFYQLVGPPITCQWMLIDADSDNFCRPRLPLINKHVRMCLWQKLYWGISDSKLYSLWRFARSQMLLLANTCCTPRKSVSGTPQ